MKLSRYTPIYDDLTFVDDMSWEEVATAILDLGLRRELLTERKRADVLSNLDTHHEFFQREAKHALKVLLISEEFDYVMTNQIYSDAGENVPGMQSVKLIGLPSVSNTGKYRRLEIGFGSLRPTNQDHWLPWRVNLNTNRSEDSLIIESDQLDFGALTCAESISFRMNDMDTLHKELRRLAMDRMFVVTRR